MPDRNGHRQRRLYPYVFFGIGGVLAASALIFHVLAVTRPAWHGMQALAVTCVCIAAVAVAATLVYRRVDGIGRDVAALGYEVGRAVAFAEQNSAMLQGNAALMEHLAAAPDRRESLPGRAWLAQLRHDLDVLGDPSVADLEPMLALRRIAERLHDADR